MTSSTAKTSASADTQSPVLIRLPNWVGDVCMSLPVLDLFEAARIPYAICARSWAQPFLSGFSNQGFCKVEGKLLNDIKSLRSWLSQNPGYKRALLLPDSLSSALVFKAAGLRSVGYRDDGRSLLLTHPVTKPTTSQHATQYWFALARDALRIWGLDPGPFELPAQISLRLTGLHTSCASTVLSAHQLLPKKFILIAPTATGLHHGQIKVWSHFDALTRALQQAGYTVAMCPPPAERDAARLAAPSALLLPPMDLGGFAALAQLAALVICNDSGVAHIAAAVNATQITIFGVTNPARTRPWTPTSINLGQTGQWPSTTDVIDCAKVTLNTLVS
ncbi:glycosyltransferase family 9 protein [Jezberella montanilacus]|nr:glycosyltransferase family 9 protein [Jezberella montanilacus]|eukprot:gene4063-4114_t